MARCGSSYARTANDTPTQAPTNGYGRRARSHGETLGVSGDAGQ